MNYTIFDEAYEKLNNKQREAVDSTEGSVMVVAGPGTGKTQILALRIGNILKKTDTKADGILCLTFTNAGVSAMKERLRKYIGPTGGEVNVFTFHSFGMKVIEEFYQALDIDSVPKLLDDVGVIALCDEILHAHAWEHIRPRSDSSRYFKDLKSLVSLLKREKMTSDDLLIEIEKDIHSLRKNPDNISTRGESKGQLKKDILKKIESLDKTREVVKFFELYEDAKKAKNVLDYDDVLINLIKIVEASDEARDSIRERYLYILIDEHQDSSGIQNEFLKKVWGDVEAPNIFVVGDDRQLIYGFGGASLDYFEGFKHAFGKAHLVALVDNYRSTQVILDSAHAILASSMVKDKLVSHSKENHKIRLVECDYPRDEILACALDIKEKLKMGIDINECAILVPKNRQVESAVTVLRDMGMPVSALGNLSLFNVPEAQSLFRILKIMVNPYDGISLSQSFLDKLSGIKPLDAHTFLSSQNMKKFSLASALESRGNAGLFDGENSITIWIDILVSWQAVGQRLGVYPLIQKIGEDLLLLNAKSHEELIVRVEVIRTILHLALSQIEKNPKLTLKEFLDFIDRLELYDERIPLAVFSKDEGIKVLTLHASKGLEFDYVWIAHMDERSLLSGKRQGFALPSRIEERVEKKDEEVVKRQLYVAVTRAKRFCALSYAKYSYTGGEQELASVISDIPDGIFDKISISETEKAILGDDPKSYVKSGAGEEKNTSKDDLVKIVSSQYQKRNVSVSLLNNFFECPWKWYFRNILQLPESKSESLEFGNAVHSSIDRILKMGKPKTQEIMDIVSEEVEKTQFGDGEIEEQMKKEIFNIVDKWVKNRLPDISPKRESEKSISVRDDIFPHLSIYGKIDLIERLDAENVRVTDFKTGSPRKKSDIEKIDDEGRMSSYMRQLAMYSYLLGKSTDWKVDVRESRLEFLEAKDKKENFYDKIITKEEMNLLIKDITDYDEIVKKGEWTQRPCDYNSYGKNTECEYCKLSEIYK